jgi:hypothetical protein
MSRGSGEGSRSDTKRRFLEGDEDLLVVDPSNVVLFEKSLNTLRLEARGVVAMEEQLEELAKEGVQSTVARSERQEVRPTTYEQISDLRAERDVVFDELVASA